MKDILLIISMLLEILLFIIFVSTGIGKVTNPRKYVSYIHKHFLLLRNVNAKSLIHFFLILGALEISLGVLTLFNVIGVYALVTILCVYIVYLFQIDSESSCNCGGVLDYFSSNKYQSLLRNIFLMIGSGLIIVVDRTHIYSYDFLILLLAISTLFFVLTYFNVKNLNRKGDTYDT